MDERPGFSDGALDPRVVVPGHGPVMHDLRYVRSVREWLSRINREASAAVARRDSLATALKTVTFDDVRLAITGDEKWMNFLFRQFFVRPAVQAAFEQSLPRAQRRASAEVRREDGKAGRREGADTAVPPYRHTAIPPSSTS
jgi:hypothetical protein